MFSCQVQHTHVCHTTATSSTAPGIPGIGLPHGDMTVHILDNAESLQSMCSEIVSFLHVSFVIIENVKMFEKNRMRP